jgi:hypothetical protein
MPYFCVACGAFSENERDDCEICGTKRESPKIIDLVAPRRGAPSDADHDDEEYIEVISRPKYLWYQISRPWRVRWRRGLLWRVALTTVATAASALPIVGGIYWWSQQQCDARIDVTCTATVLQIVAPVSPGFAERLGEQVTDRELLLAAEIYDAIVLLGLAWSQDGQVSGAEVTRVSAGDENICITIRECLSLLEAGENIDYDGVSGSVYLTAGGRRGSYIVNRATNVRSTDVATAGVARLIALPSISARSSLVAASGTTISVVGYSPNSTRITAARLAEYDLRTAGVNIRVESEPRSPQNLVGLGDFVVAVDDSLSDEALSEIVGQSRVVIAVGTEWRHMPQNAPWLRLSAHTSLLARALALEVTSSGEIQVIGRCDVYSQRLYEDLTSQLAERQPPPVMQFDCLERLLANSQPTATAPKNIETLIVAAPGNTEVLLRTLLESGYLPSARKVILLKSLSVRAIGESP